MSGRAAWRLFQAAANVSSWTPWSGAKKRDAENRGAGSVVLISLGHAYATELNNSMTFSDSTILLSVLSKLQSTEAMGRGVAPLEGDCSTSITVAQGPLKSLDSKARAWCQLYHGYPIGRSVLS